jgi:hypothetical protein
MIIIFNDHAVLDAAWGDDRSALSDADLVTQARKLREVAARAQGRQYWLLEEFLRRRPASRKNRHVEAQDERRDIEEGITADAPARPRRPVTPSTEAQGELAMAFTLTEYSAAPLRPAERGLACGGQRHR